MLRPVSIQVHASGMTYAYILESPSINCALSFSFAVNASAEFQGRRLVDPTSRLEMLIGR